MCLLAWEHFLTEDVRHETAPEPTPEPAPINGEQTELLPLGPEAKGPQNVKLDKIGLIIKMYIYKK